MGEKSSGRRLVVRSSGTCGEGEYEISNSRVSDSKSVWFLVCSAWYFSPVLMLGKRTRALDRREHLPCGGVGQKYYHWERTAIFPPFSFLLWGNSSRKRTMKWNTTRNKLVWERWKEQENNKVETYYCAGWRNTVKWDERPCRRILVVRSWGYDQVSELEIFLQHWLQICWFR